MSYNPRVHSSEGRVSRRPLPVPQAGRKHSTIAAKQGIIGVHTVDLNNRVTTMSGWRIPYFSGDQFEVYYELLCARNSLGMVKHPSKDRCVRVLGGHLFVTSDGEINTVLTNQVCSLKSGTAYELASSGDSDVEMLVIQAKDYEKDLEKITEPNSKNSTPVVSVVERVVTPKTNSEAAKIEAERIKSLRAERNNPVPKRPRRQPLPGQQVEGINPRPVGAGGFGGDE